MLLDPAKVQCDFDRMSTRRSQYDALFAEIAMLVFPRQDVYFGGGLDAAQWNRWRNLGDTAHSSYAAQALEDGVSAFEGFVMPRGERWQGLELADESLMAKVSVQQWLELVERRLFALRNDPLSGFANALHESSCSLFAYGYQSLNVDLRFDYRMGDYAGLSYESDFVGDVWFECDAQGNPLRSHKRFVLNAEAAMLKFGADAPPKVREALAKQKPDLTRQFTFLHVIDPNEDMVRGRMDARGKPWKAGYYSVDDRMMVRQGGYDTLPRIISRFLHAPGADYGYSPTMTVLPDIRMLEEIMLDRAAGAELRLKPPLLTTDDSLDSAVLEYKAYGITEGGLDDRGNPLVREFLTQADASDAMQLTLEKRAAIDKGYYRDLLQLNRELKTHVSAARTMEEIAEKGLLLSPLARQEQGMLSPMTQRELALMAELGMMDDMPGEVAEYFAAEGGIVIRYKNGLSQMQEAGKSAGYLNLAQQVGLLAQFDPSVVEDFKREYPMHRVLPELGRIAGVPASMKASDEDRAAFDEAKAAKAQLDMLLQAAPAIGGAAKDIAAAAPVA